MAEIIINPLTNYWVVVTEEQQPIISTIAADQLLSISLWLRDYRPEETWDYYVEMGYRCINVDISFIERK